MSIECCKRNSTSKSVSKKDKKIQKEMISTVMLGRNEDLNSEPLLHSSKQLSMHKYYLYYICCLCAEIK